MRADGVRGGGEDGGLGVGDARGAPISRYISPYTSPIPPVSEWATQEARLYLPYISPYLPYISPTSRPYLAHISHRREQQHQRGAALLPIDHDHVLLGLGLGLG